MGWFLKMFSSSIGQKLIMAATGLFLISFLVVHCAINSLIFFNDGGVTFDAGAEFMSGNPVIRTMEIVLFIGLILHIIKGYALWLQNSKARPVKYAAFDGKSNSKWYSRSMGLLGTLLLMFLIIHLRQFWVVSRFTDQLQIGKETLFVEMKAVFEQLWVVILYVLAMVSLAYHLMHGFQSAFQTLGLNHQKYTPFIKAFGIGFSIVLPVIFAMMPISMYLKFIQ